jgi:hypothetical protein
MKLIYLTNDGKARVETAKVGTRLIEMPDGYHPITNDSVWQDAQRKSDGMMILFQGVLPAYGGTMAEADTMNVLREVEYAEKSFKPMSNSKMWQRSLASLWAFGMKYGITLFIVILAAYSIYASFSE